MGNRVGKLTLCCAGDAGEISRRMNAAAVPPSDPPDEGFGHSFCYIPPELPHRTHSPDAGPPPFRTISGASISANPSTALSTTTSAALACSSAADKASAFESSNFFSSIPLQPIPRSSAASTVIRSGPIPRNPGPNSGPMERGFMSGPIERSFISGPLDYHPERYRPKSKKTALLQTLKKIVSKSFRSSSKKPENNGNNNNSAAVNFSSSNGSANSSRVTSNNLSSDMSFDDVINASFGSPKNVQWAQGKAGEDRVHITVSQEHDWIFVGIYDGFNGPDATDFLLNNLYSNVRKEVNGLLWCDEKKESFEVSRSLDSKERVELDRKLREKLSSYEGNGIITTTVNHLGILKALLEALKKTEASYLEITDMMLIENPELALMGSCVLAMVMKGDDVYLMNVGDSRAVLARKKDENENENESHFGKKSAKDYEESLYGYEYDDVRHLSARQLTMDHSTSVKEEVRRIKNEHSDDPFAIFNDRVKGSLKVTRAFGAGLDFHELLDIPQGDRRRYHDDVSIIIISFEGRIWRSAV
ncbi:protein phosphatase 2c [Striga asiatica]|uniref:Protein phosphatase 2c n=1 Tax=Striga asiatica TaxID=4170 RepID=A0A5A7RJ65_STRAF|nr:protein phosphatase 2c [Striga asiatica]